MTFHGLILILLVLQIKLYQLEEYEVFKEYSYFIGQNSLGVGTELAEYTSFAIKIVMQGTNSSLPPVIKDFRAIAFQA